MTINKNFAISCLILTLCLTQFPPSAFSAQTKEKIKVETTLSANDISYNINTGDARAVGNVVIKREGATLTGDEAEGNTNEEIMTIRGNVQGEFPEQRATMKSERAVWTGDKTKQTNGLIEAFGKVRLTYGETDYLNANYVRWEPNTLNYSARGNVDGRLQNKILKADEARRNGNRFWAAGVRRFEDLINRYVVTAQKVDGTLIKDPKTGQDVVNKMTADRNVLLDYVDNDGLATRVTGEKAVYSKANGTIVISGNTKAVRSDGKTVTADSMILHEQSRVIEAKGNSQIMFVTEEQKKPSSKTAESDPEESVAEAQETQIYEEPKVSPRTRDNVTEEELRWLEGN